MRPMHYFPQDLHSAFEFKFNADCKSRGKWCLGRIFLTVFLLEMTHFSKTSKIDD